MDTVVWDGRSTGMARPVRGTPGGPRGPGGHPRHWRQGGGTTGVAATKAGATGSGSEAGAGEGKDLVLVGINCFKKLHRSHKQTIKISVNSNLTLPFSH